MPELPDLQIFSKNLKKKVSDKKIVSVEVFNKSKLNVDASVVKSKLLDTKIVDIVREGKELYFQLMTESSRTFCLRAFNYIYSEN